MNKTVVKYMLIVFITILVVVAIASYFNYKYDNAVGPNLITAFVGVAVSALVTLVLLNGQTKDEEEKDKNIKMFQYKQRCYTDFVNKLWSCKGTDDFDKIEGSMRNLIFVINPEILPALTKSIRIAKNECETRDKAAAQYANITKLLRDDLLNENNDEKQIELVFQACYYEPQDQENNGKTIKETSSETHDNNIEEDFQNPMIQKIWQDYQNGKLHCWHFNAWDNEIQNECLDENKDYEGALISLFECGEDWRTNRLQEVKEGDIVFLFNRGGDGYVGMYRATGTVVVKVEDGKYYLTDTGKDIVRKLITDEEAEQYDIYGELKDEYCTSVASIRVLSEEIHLINTYNPINVIRQTIARVSEGNVWKLLKYFDGFYKN